MLEYHWEYLKDLVSKVEEKIIDFDIPIKELTNKYTEFG